MNIYKNPDIKQWPKLIIRPQIDQDLLNEVVRSIMSDVKLNGDSALMKYAERFDGVTLRDLAVSPHEVELACSEVSWRLKDAIGVAYQNIYSFHNAQQRSEQVLETSKGVKCWRKNVAIEKVGLYIPGGNAPLFSTILMLGIPAKIAGCKEIILCTPPDKNKGIHPAVLYVAKLVGVTSIYRVGGAQAVAAMAYGTSTIPRVYKIFGPGNQYVTKAKEIAQQEGQAIDMPAGPSEVLIIADDTCNPAFVAADLLSQAEHGPDSQCVLLSHSEAIIDKCLTQVSKQMGSLSRKDIAKKSLRNGRAISFENIEECVEFSNCYAPEHLILACEDFDRYVDKILNAGSVFLGNYSCESAGDYASGTNHTLPTNGFARSHSGVSLDSFVKKITFQEISREGISNIGEVVKLMAEAEQLTAHKSAVTIRLKETHEKYKRNHKT